MGKKIRLARKVVDDVMEFECLQNKAYVGTYSAISCPEMLFLIFLFVCFVFQWKIMFWESIVTTYSNSQLYSCFNTIALNVQIYIIQPTICEQLENADNRANAALGFYLQSSQASSRQNLLFFLLHYHCKSLKGGAELSLFCRMSQRIEAINPMYYKNK